MPSKFTRQQSVRVSERHLLSLQVEAQEKGVMMASVMLRMIIMERLASKKSMEPLRELAANRPGVGSKGPRIGVRVTVDMEGKFQAAITEYAKGEVGGFVQAVLAERYDKNSKRKEKHV